MLQQWPVWHLPMLFRISHSIAHKIGGEYGIPHGRTNAILLPHVIRYNAKDHKNMHCFLNMISLEQILTMLTLQNF